jgi:hypothetical protein
MDVDMIEKTQPSPVALPARPFGEVYRTPNGAGNVCVTESGRIAIEHEGRRVVKTVKQWVSLGWGDIDEVIARG